MLNRVVVIIFLIRIFVSSGHYSLIIVAQTEFLETIVHLAGGTRIGQVHFSLISPIRRFSVQLGSLEIK